jgi:hypothetical protein
MQSSQSTWGMKTYGWLLLLALAPTACKEEPNAGVCCTTDEDCARLGGILPRGCPDGYACRNLRCEPDDCAAAADCSAEQPVCDLESASCTGCTASSDCDDYADAPICDPATSGCRACRLDAECASADTAGCTHPNPCSVGRAIAVASADPSISLVRLLPGTYTAQVIFTSGTVKVIGTGASLMMTPYPTVEARESAIVEIRGVDVHGYVGCTGTGNLFPSLTLQDSTIRSGYTAMVAHGMLRMLRSSVERAFSAVAVLDDGTFEADRAYFEGSLEGGIVSTMGRRMRVRITNSILDRITLSISSNDEAPDQSDYYISFSTFIFDNQARIQNCPDFNDNQRSVLFENNIFFGSSAQVQNVISGWYCTLAGNITYPQNSDLGGTNIAQDPRFVNPQGKDYRLQPGSPAVDAAISSSAPGLDHDFAGTPRPQGGRRDIGAFELRP